MGVYLSDRMACDYGLLTYVRRRGRMPLIKLSSSIVAPANMHNRRIVQSLESFDLNVFSAAFIICSRLMYKNNTALMVDTHEH